MKLEKIIAGIGSLICFILPAWADEIQQQLSVDQAYQAIPHQRTSFDTATALMASEERQFLALFFELTDIAVAERVSQQMAIPQKQALAENYAEILRRFTALVVPVKLSHIHILVIDAIKSQQVFLGNLKNKSSAFDLNSPLVESSHAKLIQAYSELMRLYPEESTHNKQAFFDHLCSLDFK